MIKRNQFLKFAIAATVLFGSGLSSYTFGFDKKEEERLFNFMEKNLPLADRINYPEEFIKENIRTSLRAREEMPWGKIVPDREFMHFVLPIRVNNENLDNSRMVFFEELAPRIKNLSMKDAILEVNHWAHEKVTYQPSDARTSSPLSAVSQAIGRCGEESTFLVAALRAVGIPSRQVYTPRWAHTDDNHAWVEAWADGKWYFLGACEPEPILDLAWFNAPASRGMMMHTSVFGNYDGPEEVISRNAVNTVINVTSNYAPVKETTVRILDKNNHPINGADVNFCLYNYAEFFSLASKKTDENGLASLTTGLGDMVVWANDGNNFAIKKVNPNDSPIDIVLDLDKNFRGCIDFNVIPPNQSANLPVPSKEQIAENDRRKSYEDSIRMSYVATFANDLSIAKAAQQLNLDKERLGKILRQSRGNHVNIIHTLDNMTPEKREIAIDLLEAVNEKDRRDIPMEVLTDAVENVYMSASPLYKEYILNPRIETEWFFPWRGKLAKAYSEKEKKEFRSNPEKLVNEVRNRIKIDSVNNPSRLRINPAAVHENKISDSHNRNIYFVALGRAVGIPCRIDQITGKTQYADNEGKWIDVKFEEVSQGVSAPSGNIEFTTRQTGKMTDPGYYYNFSISKIENGYKHLLEYDDDTTLKYFDTTANTSLDEGQYILTTGQRLANGGVLVHSEIFGVDENKVTRLPFEMRQDNSEIQVCGSMNAENIYHDQQTGLDKSLLSTTGRGYYIMLLMKPNHEPSEHALNEISALSKEFEKDGRKLMLLFSTEDEMNRFKADRFNLPANVVMGYDVKGDIAREMAEIPGMTIGDYPCVIIADTFNRVVFVSSGYTIGLGRRLMNTMTQLTQ